MCVEQSMTRHSSRCVVDVRGMPSAVAVVVGDCCSADTHTAYA